MTMTADQIEQERRRGRRAGLAAIASALTFAGGAFWYQGINSDAPEENSPALLRFFDANSGELLAASALQAVGMLLLAPAAIHLWRATRARRPEATSVVLMVAIYGPVAFALSTLARAIALAVLASDFTGREFQSLAAADDVFESPVLVAATVLGFSGVIALAFWFVKGCLDALRVGLLSRFMGVIGIAMGPALVFGFGTLLMPVWLIALGSLYLGFWPRGVPPAWPEGRAMETPVLGAPPADAAPEAPGGGRNGEVSATGPGVRKVGDADRGGDG
jgi:hypothetical protein